MAKEFGYVTKMLGESVKMRVIDKVGMSRRLTLEPTDSRRISKTLAPVEPPSTETLVEQHVSRLTV